MIDPRKMIALVVAGLGVISSSAIAAASTSSEVRDSLQHLFHACEDSVVAQSSEPLVQSGIVMADHRQFSLKSASADVDGLELAISVSRDDDEQLRCSIRTETENLRAPYWDPRPTLNAWGRAHTTPGRETYFDPFLEARIVYNCIAPNGPYRATGLLQPFGERERTLARGQGVEVPQGAVTFSFFAEPITEERCARIITVVDEHGLRGT